MIRAKTCKQCAAPFETQTRAEFCNIKCKNTFNVLVHRVRLKDRAIAYKGGKCVYCGYNKSRRSMVFHHLDPTQKEFGIGGNGATRSWDKLVVELDKCVLVCANCHGELHDNSVPNPIRNER